MILVRHAQSEFNVHYSRTRVDPGIRDPALTELGFEQARDTAAQLRALPARRIVTSPYTRALQTAEILHDELGLPVEIDPIVGERCAFVCDLGSTRDELAARFPRFAFDHLAHEWWPVPIEEEDGLMARCDGFRTRMAADEAWAGTVIVTHWGFIRGLTGETVGNCAVLRFDPTAPR
ncbi:MAG: histidine phosphatase family protein [Rhodospirillaceae bacterium]|nr:histidine phosphatase family protein [Rhodospirillaceae bacterium]MBT5412960.1 histidine phosphatase family protein [Rhodospirillaceae bacterium]MBT6118004.1 histidine phosphatase family protein [Rhodospirillaceae bacterium]